MSKTPEAFYIPRGDASFTSTEHTAGPWSADAQHFGPPSALLVRALEGLPADRPMQIARVTVEILGSLPVADVTVQARVVRPGRSVELIAAELSVGTKLVATATAWRIASSDSSEVVTGGADSLPSPDGFAVRPRPENWGAGYLDAMEIRPISGALDIPGPSVAWMRQRVALVEGEAPTGLQRLFAVADSGNGLSSLLDPTRWWFINTELTVHIQRVPVGEWIGMDAKTVVGPAGVGTALTTIHDLQGQVGKGSQALMIRPR
ncbi:thioesterase family protein [Smaragdicoccus niigatensis]|uniref:thioesterase family protein n=1 Tax=Smaragdicoccus niigatensis TaxID=359359 RepID=UPI0003760099|nr:thioesterase family protein [Smaragdicoccus niigatensis]